MDLRSFSSPQMKSFSQSNRVRTVPFISCCLPSICSRIYFPFLSFFTSILFFSSFFLPSIFVLFRLSVSLSMYTCVCECVRARLSILVSCEYNFCLSLCVCVCLSLCLNDLVSVYLSVYLCVCLCVSICVSMCVFYEGSSVSKVILSISIASY